MRNAVLAAVVLILAVACGDPEPKLGEESPRGTDTANTAPPAQMATGDNTSTMQPVVPPQLDSPTSRVGGVAPTTRDIHLLEYQIHMPQTLPAGEHTFSVENAGKEDHAVEIHGNGIHAQTPTIKRGDRATLTVNLKPGTYTVYCPVNGHKGHGMQTTLTVQ